MRRSVLTVALLIVITALPVCAQRRGMAPRGGASVGVRSSGRVVVRGGFGFGHNPRFGVFIGARPFHHRRFFRPFPFASTFGYPYAYPYMAYPYYPYGLQSDFVYSNYAAPQDYNAG